jgi:hypothetical protein
LQEALIKDLDEENTRLIAENEALKGELAGYRFVATRWKFVTEDYAQPTPEQLVEIRRATMARGKQLNPEYFRRGADDMDRVSVKAFESAFAACATTRRSETLDTKYGVQMLADGVSDRAKAMNLSSYSDIGIGILVAAIIASNDVAFLDLIRAPYDLAFALRIGDGPGVRSTGAGWRNLLAGKYLAPIPAPPLKQEIRSQSRVRNG